MLQARKSGDSPAHPPPPTSPFSVLVELSDLPFLYNGEMAEAVSACILSCLRSGKHTFPSPCGPARVSLIPQLFWTHQYLQVKLELNASRSRIESSQAPKTSLWIQSEVAHSQSIPGFSLQKNMKK